MRKFILLSLSVVLFCQSCAAQQVLNTPALEATAAPSIIATEVIKNMPTMPSPSITIDPMKERGKVVIVPVGIVFAVTLPQGSSRWKLDYASSVFQPLTPAENMNEPGSQGWLFRAIAVKQSDIRLTALAEPCNQSQPCPPAPPITYVFTVDVK